MPDDLSALPTPDLVRRAKEARDAAWLMAGTSIRMDEARCSFSQTELRALFGELARRLDTTTGQLAAIVQAVERLKTENRADLKSWAAEDVLIDEVAKAKRLLGEG